MHDTLNPQALEGDTGRPIPPSQLCVLAVVLGVTLRATAGFYYETNDDPIMEMIFRGVLFPDAATREIGFAHLFTASLMGRLYRALPHFPWYGATMYALSLLALLNMLLFVDGRLQRATGAWRRRALLVCLAFVLASQSLVLLNFTRVAILLAGSSTLLLTRAVGSVTQRRWSLPLLAALFGLGMVTRPEGGLLGLFVATPIALSATEPRSFRVAASAAGVLCVVALATVVSANSSGVQTRLHSAAPFLVNVNDFQWSREAQLAGDDLLRLRAVKKWLFSDSSLVAPQFLSRVTSASRLSWDKLRSGRLKASLAGLGSSLGVKGWLLIALDLVLHCVLLRGRGTRQQIARHGLSRLPFWLAALTVAVFMHAPARVLDPLIALYACAVVSSLCLCWPSADEPARRVAQVLLGLALAASAATTAHELNRGAARWAVEQRTSEALLGRLGDIDAPVVLLPPALRAYRYLDPLAGVPVPAGTPRLLIFGGWPCLLTSFAEEMDSLAGSDVFPTLLTSLARRGVFVLSDGDYNAFLAEYASTLYRLSVSFRRGPKWLRGEGHLRRVRLYAFRAGWQSGPSSNDGRAE